MQAVAHCWFCGDIWACKIRFCSLEESADIINVSIRMLVFCGLVSGPSEVLEREDDDARRVDVYDIPTDLWHRCADIPHELDDSYLTAPTVLGGRIYVLTKSSANESRIQMYCPISDTWEDFKLSRCNFNPLHVQGPLLLDRPYRPVPVV